jgi:alkanesulfonate monooxygenase SsuD/methylene tetrahydromethanopterin reductase-like flavin-dependent oxidoreductase (luciferase family)
MPQKVVGPTKTLYECILYDISAMKFGIYLNQYGDPRYETTFDDMFEQTSVMEALGYDTAVVGERHFYDDGFYDPFTCLSALGARTESLGLMANILMLPVYHPIHLAEQIANIDVLNGGDTRWGISLGYREIELENFGVDMDDRVGRFMESIHLLKRLLEGERFDHDGDHFSFEDAFIRPKPEQDPRPRLYGGGNADVAIKRAAYRCDGFTAAVTVPEELESDIELYEESIEEAGKNLDNASVTIMVDGYVAETEEAAYEALNPYMLDLHEQYMKWGNPEFEGRPTFEDVEDQCIIGTPSQVAETVERFRDMGVDHLIFRTQFGGMSQESTLESIRLFGEEVAPEFR